MDTELKGQASQEQLDEWKVKHGAFFGIKVDGHICYLRKPDRKQLSYISGIGTKDGIKSNEILMKSCWLGGSEDIQSDDALFLGACAHLSALIEVKQAELVKF